jgi:hypothetical protein
MALPAERPWQRPAGPGGGEAPMIAGRRSLLALACAAVLAFGSCGAGTPSQVEAEAATCEALQAWSDAMQTLVLMDGGNASVDEVKAQRSVVQSAWAEVKDAYADVEGADTAALQEAAALFERALRNIPPGVPVTDIIANLRIAAVPLQAAYGEVANGLGCEIANPF